MYLPEYFKEEDCAELAALMQRYPLATLIAAGDDGELEVNHIPLEYAHADGQYGVLRGHIAKANPLAQLLEKPRRAHLSRRSHGSDCERGTCFAGGFRGRLGCALFPSPCQVFFMSLRICILETDILRPELVDQYQGYGQMFQRLFGTPDQREGMQA